MKKIKLLLLGALLLGNLANGKTYQIGTSQIIEHPALDAVRIGVEEELTRAGIDYKLDSQIAQGDMTTQQLIMKKFAQDKKDYIVAISTPTAQAALNATKDIPILFGAVTDPQGAGLVENTKNVTGITDKLSPQAMVDLTKKLLPGAKTVGVIYNPSEKNSEVTIEAMKEITAKANYKLLAIGVTSSTELPSALETVMNKADVLYTITDNLTVAAAPLIYSKASTKNFPVIAMEGVSQVPLGALAGFEIDYKLAGVEIGKMIVKLINGESLDEIPIIEPENYPILINEEVANKLKVIIPEELKRNNN